jgi:adenylate kinase family enzyme
VIFIGGASAAGKTTFAQQLGRLLQLPVLSLDRFYGAIGPAFVDGEEHRAATRRICRALVRELLLSGARCIVEGGWLRPPGAAALRSDYGLEVLYCGFPETTAAERLRAIRSAEGEPHWLAAQSDAQALAWLEGQIEGSRRQRDQCAVLGLSYLDCSRFEEGAAALPGYAASLWRA